MLAPLIIAVAVPAVDALYLAKTNGRNRVEAAAATSSGGPEGAHAAA